jgi:hypothetical protein
VGIRVWRVVWLIVTKGVSCRCSQLLLAHQWWLPHPELNCRRAETARMIEYPTCPSRSARQELRIVRHIRTVRNRGLRVWPQEGVVSWASHEGPRKPLGPCIAGSEAEQPRTLDRREAAEPCQSETVPERVRHWTLVDLDLSINGQVKPFPRLSSCCLSLPFPLITR